MTIAQDRLDELWDFEDAAASEARLRAAADAASGADADELQTQVARALGLQGRFAAADAVLDALDPAASPAVQTRVVLERGRLRNSAGDADACTDRALAELATTDDARTLRWRVGLYNNRGWARFDEGRWDDALVAFQASRDAAVRWGTAQQVEWADEAIAETRAAIDPAGR
ncbi:MAG: hypothetical protein J0J00_06515 [Microbacterium sp.]|nr:hypothetical protein [Microbacterium sp.]